MCMMYVFIILALSSYIYLPCQVEPAWLLETREYNIVPVLQSRKRWFILQKPFNVVQEANVNQTGLNLLLSRRWWIQRCTVEACSWQQRFKSQFCWWQEPSEKVSIYIMLWSGDVCEVIVCWNWNLRARQQPGTREEELNCIDSKALKILSNLYIAVLDSFFESYKLLNNIYIN